MKTTNILIVDDHAVVRAGLKGILSEGGESFTISEAGNGADAIRLLRQQSFDVVLLDIGLPGKNGVEVLKQIRAEWKSLPVLILSMYPEDQYAIRALRAGANGYMTKESAPEVLLTAIRRVIKGGRYISPQVADLLAFEVNDESSDRAPHTMLSDREFQVLKLIGSGRTVSEISEALNLSVKTVSTYRARVLEKMKMRTNAELTHYAVKHDLVE